MIETERLHLRPHRMADLQDLHDLTAAPSARRFLAGGEQTLEDSFMRLLRIVGGWSEFGYGHFAAVERATGRYVGNVGVFRMLRTIDGEALEAAEAGWIIAEDCWGRGYAGEAMSAALAWFEGRNGPTRTFCMIVPGNTASERLAARLGYRAFREGRRKGEQVTLYERQPDGSPDREGV